MKMKLNTKKTKAMIFNFSKKHQFTTRLKLKSENIELVNEAKILGTIITNDLKWKRNTENLVKRANSRMLLLSKASNFGASIVDLKEIYVLFIRSLLEQSCVVWSSNLTKEDILGIERIQTSAIKLILNDPKINYRKALEKLNLESLEDRRIKLSLNFAKRCLKTDLMSTLFPENSKKHNFKLRKTEKYEVKYARTERLKQSAIPKMQMLLNDDELKNNLYRK